MKLKLIAASVLSLFACSQASADLKQSSYMQEKRQEIAKHAKTAIKSNDAVVNIDHQASEEYPALKSNDAVVSTDYQPSEEYMDYYNSLQVTKMIKLEPEE